MVAKGQFGDHQVIFSKSYQKDNLAIAMSFSQDHIERMI
jgi:hypothetical protein